MTSAAPTLEADGLVLRALVARDEDAVHAYASSPGFFDHVDVPDRLRRAYTLDDARDFIAQAATRTWAIEADGRLVGTVRLRRASWRDGEEIGFGLAPGARGHGLATRAVQRVLGWCKATGRPFPWARTALANEASAAVLRRTGFAPVGEQEGWTHWRPPEGGPVPAPSYK